MKGLDHITSESLRDPEIAHILLILTVSGSG